MDILDFLTEEEKNERKKELEEALHSECSCENRALRHKVNKINQRRYYWQCIECGKYQPVAKPNLTKAEMLHAPEADDETRSRWYDKRMALYDKVIKKWIRIAEENLSVYHPKKFEAYLANLQYKAEREPFKPFEVRRNWKDYLTEQQRNEREKELASIFSEKKCTHQSYIVQLHIFKNCQQHYKRCCTDCFKCHEIGKKDLTQEEIDSATLYDKDYWIERRRSRWGSRSKSIHSEIYEKWRSISDEQRSRQKYSDYKLYIAHSPKWKALSRSVLKRDNFLCQCCKKQRATQTHHLTYARLFNENLDDLAAVCHDCHQQIHERNF